MVVNREFFVIKEWLGLEGVGDNYMWFGVIYLLVGDFDWVFNYLMCVKEFFIELGEVYVFIDGYLGVVYVELG